MERWKKGLVLLMAATLTGTAVIATQFVQVRSGVTVTVDTNLSFVQFMAFDRDPNVAGSPLLDNTLNSAAGTYQVALGTWMVGAKKEYSAAFALVNAEATTLTLQSIDCVGTACGGLTISVHEDPTEPCSADFPGFDPLCVPDTALPPLWVLDNGDGPYSIAGGLNYQDDLIDNDGCTAIFSGGPSVWEYDSGGAPCNNLAASGTDNFVWVSIVIDTGLLSGLNAATISFNFEA